MFKAIKLIVEEQTTKAGRFFDLFFQFLIILSLILFSLETVPDYTVYKKFFKISELVIVLFFTAEYFLRFLVANSKKKFTFSFLGLIDLFSILPFYLSNGLIDVRYLRIFRLFRLLRSFKLLRYSRAIDRLSNAFSSIKEELFVFLTMTLFILYISAAGIYHFEHKVQPEHFRSIFDALWWAVATLTTVGYGDVYPITAGGKIFTFFILMIGLGIVSVPSALLASALTKKGIS